MSLLVDQLFSLQDVTYRDFNIKLIPTVAPELIIGVRVPQLRAISKQMIRDNKVSDFLNALPHKYLEENTLHAIILNVWPSNFDNALYLVEQFLPYIDNWATCDTLKPVVFEQHPELVRQKIGYWTQSQHAFTVRFAIVSALNFFLDQRFEPQFLTSFSVLRSSHYYVNMALAWFFSVALVKQYEYTIPLFCKPTLSPWVHNKSIQKAIESQLISPEQKKYLRSLRL